MVGDTDTDAGELRKEEGDGTDWWWWMMGDVVWFVEAEDLDRDFETWWEKVESGVVIVITIAGEEVAAMVPYEMYERWMENE